MAPILDAAAALGMTVDDRHACCFNGRAHKSGRDEHPSLVFFPDSNRFMCFACGAHGDVVDLVKQVRGVGFLDAVAWLNARFGGTSAIRIASSPGGSRTPGARDCEVYAAMYERSYEIAPQMPAGRYLVDRGLDLRLVNQCNATQIGNPDAMWGELLNKFGQERLQAAGLISRNGNFLFSHHRLLFFYVYREEFVYVQARDVTGESRCKELSLAGVHSPVPYNADLLHERPDRVYLCEGAIDTLSALQLGYPAVGVPGVLGFRAEWFEMFRGIRQVIILFDNDEAGRREAAELCREFRRRGIRAQALHPRHVKDMNDVLVTRSKKHDQ